MTTFLLGFGVIVLSILGLAVGVLAGRRPIKGSCGGLSCGASAGCAGCPNARTREGHE